MIPLNSPTQEFDVVLQAGTVIDGSCNAEAVVADVGIVDDRIAAVAPASTLRGKQIIDSSGKIISPGFIDVHTHDDLALFDWPGLTPKVSQGVTTIVIGNCGLSLAPMRSAVPALPSPFHLLGARESYRFETVTEYLKALGEIPLSVNVVALVGHSNLRVSVMGDIRRSARPSEINAMQEMVEEAMHAGCVGLSSGLAYDAGFHASTEEVIALADRVGRAGGFYVTHLRDEADRVVDSVVEAIRIGREAKLPVVISHHKCMYRQNWGRSSTTLALISDASKSQKIALDAYPYTASSTVLMPERVQSAERVIISWSESHPQFAGRDLDEIAAEWQVSRTQAAEKLCPGAAVYFNMDENDLVAILCHPLTMVGSDGVPSNGRPHPRLWGTFPRVFSRYVRELKVINWRDAVHKMTGLPAQVFNLRGRGTISVGAYADITIFDQTRIADQATFASPSEPSAGIEWVFNNGKVVWQQGQERLAGSGRILRRVDSTRAHRNAHEALSL